MDSIKEDIIINSILKDMEDYNNPNINLNNEDKEK